MISRNARRHTYREAERSETYYKNELDDDDDLLSLDGQLGTADGSGSRKLLLYACHFERVTRLVFTLSTLAIFLNVLSLVDI